MALYKGRMTNDLDQIRDDVVVMGALVAEALRNAVKSCCSDDDALANHTILHDKPINRLRNSIGEQCLAFMENHRPSGDHLRQSVSIMRLADELERTGDYAVTIAREGRQLPHRPSGAIAKDMQMMADLALTGLIKAMAAFRDGDVELAREARQQASNARHHESTVYDKLVKEDGKEKIEYLFDMLTVISRLRRASERAKNVCEETIFILTGEKKKPKSFRILFLDPKNNCQSQLAEAIARKRYPVSCEYASAGLTDKKKLKPCLKEFMESRELTVENIAPKVLDTYLVESGTYDFIVSLKGPVKDYLSRQPYRTAFLEWDVAKVLDSDETDNEDFFAMYEEIAGRIDQLIEILCGEGAN